MANEPTSPAAEPTTDPDAPAGTIEAHQPGHDDETSLGDRPVDGSPTDAVVDGDEQGEDPTDRAPDPPDGATD